MVSWQDVYLQTVDASYAPCLSGVKADGRCELRPLPFRCDDIILIREHPELAIYTHAHAYSAVNIYCCISSIA